MKKTALEKWLALPDEQCVHHPSNAWKLSAPTFFSDPTSNNDALKKKLLEAMEKYGDFRCDVNDIAYYYDYSLSEIIAVDIEDDFEVGRARLAEDVGVIWLDHIKVSESCQRQGIGTNIIKVAVEEHGDYFQVPAQAGMLGNKFKYYLSEEGAALVNHCVKLGILDDYRHCRHNIPISSNNPDDGYYWYDDVDFQANISYSSDGSDYEDFGNDGQAFRAIF